MAALKNIDEVRKYLKEMDPALDLDTPSGRGAQFLMTAAQVGPGIRKISRFMGVPMSSIRTFLNQAVRNRIFRANKIHAQWLDPECGVVAFWLDVLVVTGMSRRTS